MQVFIPQGAKAWLNAVATAALCGAAGAVADMGLAAMNGPIDWKHVWSMAITGAVLGVANLLREKPATKG